MKRSWNHPKGTATPPYLFSWVHQPTFFAGQAGHRDISLSNDFGCSIVCYTNSIGEFIFPLAHFRCNTLFIKTLLCRSPTEFIFLLTLIQLRFKVFYLHPIPLIGIVCNRLSVISKAARAGSLFIDAPYIV